MKKLIIASFCIVGSYMLSSCNSNSNTESTSSQDSTMTDTSSKSGTETMNNPEIIDQKTKDFTADAATGGMMEVELGKLAEQKATSQAVKDFGKMMVEDHSKINDTLKSIASKKNIDLPAAITDDQRKDVDKLSKKSGSDFDKAYVDMMVDDHQKDIDAFKKAEGDVTDNDIKNFITNSLPVLQKHLDAIKAIKAKM
jgi:putative membrane protein